MTTPLTSDAAATLLAAQGVAVTPEGAEANARFATLQLGNAAKAFGRLEFEREPSGYTAALRANAR